MKKKLLTMFLLSSLLLTGCSKLEKIIDILLEEETEIIETQEPEETKAQEETDEPETPAVPDEPETPAVPDEPETPAISPEPEVPENPTLPETPVQTEPEEELMSDNEAFVGYWVSAYVDKDGYENRMYLTLAADGGVSYSYGLANSEIAEMFGGTWGIADNDLVLNLTGGGFDMEANYVTNPYSLDSVYSYRWGDIGNVFTIVLKDGSPLLQGTESGEIDFWKQGTVSDTFDPMLGIRPPVYDADACVGNWYSTCWIEAGSELSMNLKLNADGTAAYCYGLGNSEIYEIFDGTWTADDNGKLTLDLYGGGVYEDSDLYDFDAVFRWSSAGSHLSLIHEEGNPLISGCEGWYFEFLPFDYTLYDGEWCTFDDDGEYNLHLLSNGDAVYTITKGDAVVSRYEGWWYASDSMELELSLQRTEGEGADTIQSTYDLDWAEFPVQMIIKLQDSGFALTVDMAVSGEDIFNWLDPYAVG